MYVKYNYKDYDCTLCTENKKRFKGCIEDGLSVVELYGVKYKRCLRSIVNNQSWYYLELHGYYKDGFMLNGPAIKDQSPKYLQVIRIIESELSKLQMEEVENGNNRK